MHTGKGCIDEIYIEGRRAARITCAPALIPAPGQYLLAHADSEPAAPLPHPIFMASPAAGGFHATPALPATWQPGTMLTLRGPFGRGFNLPTSARKIALVAYTSNAARLLSLLEPATAQKAEIALLADTPPLDLPAAIEILPVTAIDEIIPWADSIFVDIPASRLNAFTSLHRGKLPPETQLFVETAVPCGGMAECGVCAIPSRQGSLLACKDGPVFSLKEL